MSQPQAKARPETATSPREGITLRGVGLGLLASALVSAWTTYARTGVKTSNVNLTNFPISALAIFIFIAIASFVVWHRFGTGLTRSELITTLAMGLVASAIPVRGLTGVWLGFISVPYYKATAENGWLFYVQPSLQSYLFPTNDGRQMTFFYEGLPPGAEIPWNVWYVPLFWWTTLITAGFGVCLCVSVILRKQWVEHERLDYPLLAPLLEIIEDSENRENRFQWPRLVRGRYFWIGFTIAFGIITWNIVNYFVPSWPRINTSPNGGIFKFHKMFPQLLTHINTYTIGFGYFVKLEILFSIWFFHLLLMTESALLSRIGFQLGGIRVKGGGWNAVTSWQSVGALFAFVFWGLWQARAHLRAVYRKAVYPEERVDDSNEMLSYRSAFLGLLLGLVYIAGWLHHTGVELQWIAMTLPVAIVLYIALARFVCESGTLYLGLPIGPGTFPGLVFGTRGLMPSAVTGNTTGSIIRWGKFMPILSQGVRAVDRVGGSRRMVPWALLASLFVALWVNIWMVLNHGYAYGASNFNEWSFNVWASGIVDGIVWTLKSPSAPTWEWVVIFSWGGMVMSALMALRYRFSLFPIHPVGFIITTTSLLHEVSSIFIVWAFKAATLQLGGALQYTRYRPLFFGLIVGRAMGVLLSFFVDVVFFYGGGHYVHGW